MNSFPDTSFLCALYRQQENSLSAAKLFSRLSEPLHVSSLLLYEFRNSARLQIFLRKNDRAKGFGKQEADSALAAVQADMAAGALVLAAVEWTEVHAVAERLSAQYTPETGQRAFDILHVATALHLGCRQFLSFDQNQRRLAEREGLSAAP